MGPSKNGISQKRTLVDVHVGPSRRHSRCGIRKSRIVLFVAALQIPGHGTIFDSKPAANVSTFNK